MTKSMSMNGRLKNIHRGSPVRMAQTIPKTDNAPTVRTTAAIVDQRSRTPRPGKKF